jgi:type I restriction enzyme S subunit
MAEVGAIADTQLGKTLSTKQLDKGQLRPYLRNKNVQWHRVELDDVRETHFTPHEEEKYELLHGDLLVCEGGEVGRCAVWQQPRDRVYFQNALHRIRPHSGICARWLEYILRWYAESDRLSAHTSGVTISHLVQRSLRKLEIPVAPSLEQHRIVAAIEEHFSRLDALELAVIAAQRRLDALQSSVLADVFHLHDDPPPDWSWTTIGEIASVQLGRQRSPQYHTGKRMLPYLRSANVTWSGLSLHDVNEMHFDDADFDKYRLKLGDLLLNEASGSPGEVGKPAIWDGQIDDCCFQNTLLRLRPHGVELDYLFWYCYSSASSGRFGEAGRGVNIRHLGKHGLARFPIPVPPRNEQALIAERIRTALEHAAALKRSTREAVAHIATLRRSILLAAFAGRLVPQDPNDEPASLLLERIAASRAAEPVRRRSGAG